MSKYQIDKEFSKYVHLKATMSKPILKIVSIVMRKMIIPKSDNEINVNLEMISGFKDYKITVYIFTPKYLNDCAPCLIYYHGGAFAMPSAPHHYYLVKQYAMKAKCKVLYVDYRLSIEKSFPIPVEDCFESLKWAIENSERLNIDKKRIAIGGDSAGGNLAASVALMARDRLDIQPCFQMLIYPVIDRRMNTESMKRFIDTPIWNSKLSKKMWNIYLPIDEVEKIEYASPIEALSLKQLPSAYIETAEFDCLHDEAIKYANELKMNGVKVELFETKGTMHGFDMNLKSEIAKESIRRRSLALLKGFKFK